MRPNNLQHIPGVATKTVEIVVMEPREFSEALTAIQALQASKSVILKLSELDPKQVQRVIDLVTGGTYAIDGYTKWVGEQRSITDELNHMTNLKEGVSAQISLFYQEAVT